MSDTVIQVENLASCPEGRKKAAKVMMVLPAVAGVAFLTL